MLTGRECMRYFKRRRYGGRSALARALDYAALRLILFAAVFLWLRIEVGAARAAVPFGDLASYRLRQLFLTLEQYGAEYVTFAELEQASPQLSFAVYGEDGELEACSVLGEQPGGFCLKQFFCRQTRLNAALTALRASAEALIARGPADAVLEVPVVSDSAAQLARKLLAAAGTSGQLTRAVYLPG